VSIRAASDASTGTSALPEELTGGVSGAASVGIGASVAVAIVDDTTTAELTGTLNGGRNLVLYATTTHLETTTAKTGAAGGKVAISPAVAIALSNITTTATVSTGNSLVITGSFSATADQTASAVTSAAGDAKDATTAAVGVALALTIANHRTEATLARNLNTSGPATLAAHGKSESSADAHASAAGAPGDSTSSGGNSGNGVSNQVEGERTYGKTKRNDTRGTPGASDGGDSTPKSDTSSGGVSVAAAVAINLAKTTSRATLIGAITVNTNGGRFTLSTSADTDAKATADGSAVQPPDASASSSGSSGSGGSGGSGGSSGSSGSGSSGSDKSSVAIGVAVAVNYARIENEAILPATAIVIANGVTVEALMASTHELGASATSGAGGGTVGVAGSVAVNVEIVTTTASIDGTTSAGSGDVNVIATSHLTAVNKALPEEKLGGVSGSSKVGVGASVVVVVANDTTTATINGQLTGGRNVTVRATTTHSDTTTAKTGAFGGNVTVAPAIAAST